MKHLLFLSISYILLSINQVYGKDQDFIDKNEMNPDESLAGAPNHPYVGIPIGTWQITDLNKSEKEELCVRQQSFCANECGNQVNKNYCNYTTMSWMCSCQNHVPDVPPYHWPITLAECQGREQSCINGCTYGATKAICIKACNKYFKCDQAGSPSSGLVVEKEDQMPTYGSSSSSSYRDKIMKYTTLLINFFVYFICSYM